MKKYFKITILALILGTISSCEDPAVYTPNDRFVLQAYLYAGEPVFDIKIRNAVPLTVTDSVGEPINDASVVLYRNGVGYPLVSSSDTGTYMYPGNNLIVTEGETFNIEATWGTRTATAETTVPEPPVGVVISSDTIELPEIDWGSSGTPNFEVMRELMDAQQNVKLEVYWDNPNTELHFVVVENAEEDQESIFPAPGGGFGRLDRRGGFRRISAPTRESSYQINFNEIQYWGKYIVKVYRVNKEYADLYDNLQQDSRDLNEPPTNIKNGLGIFSAFNSVNTYFTVVKK